MTPISSVNFTTNFVNASYIYNGARTSAAQNDEISFDVVLAVGTWTVELMHKTFSTMGIYSVQLDGVEVGTIDGYSAGEVWNVRTSVSGVSVSIAGKKRLKLKMATKNASSSAYAANISHIQLRRTA